MANRLPIWLHISGVVSALTAIGGMATAIIVPDAETAALLPVGVMGIFATSQIATDKLSRR